MQAKYSVEFNLVSHQVRRKRAIFLDTLQCFLGLFQIVLSIIEYQEFTQPVFWESKDFFVTTDTCNSLRTINLSINVAILINLVFHYKIMYKNAVYEGIEYMYDKKASYTFLTSIYFTKLMAEIVIFSIIIPPKFLYAKPLLLFTLGQGYGKSDLKYSLNSFLFIWFVVARVLLICRIITRYSKFRSFRSE
jgi:hypothetical protein